MTVIGRTAKGGGEVLELAILGLLLESPMHGYELRKRLTGLLGAFRAFSYGSLYPTLRRMQADGLIDSAPGRGSVVLAPDRPRAPALSAADVIAAAVAIADAESMQAVSMHSICSQSSSGRSAIAAAFSAPGFQSTRSGKPSALMETRRCGACSTTGDATFQ